MSAVSMHNDLMVALGIEGDRFGIGLDLGGPFSEGDAGHVEDHNRICRALLDLRNRGNALGATPHIVITLPDLAYVGDNGHLGDHSAIAAALAVIQAAVI